MARQIGFEPTISRRSDECFAFKLPPDINKTLYEENQFLVLLFAVSVFMKHISQLNEQNTIPYRAKLLLV